MVATDTHRLALKRHRLPDSDVELTNVVIPAKAINELYRALGVFEGDVLVDVAPNHVAFRCGSLRIITRLIDGRYPDYRQVIPKSYLTRLNALDGSAFLRTIERAAVFAQDEVVTGPDGGSGFAEVFGRRLDAVDPAAVGRRAADKAVRSASPRAIEPGEYEVVLEPNAVSTLVGFLAYIGFGGRALTEGRSCLSGKEGQRVADPRITIYDDALSPETIGLPFDFEGTPRRRVDLIRDGVFLDGVYDRRTAKQAGKETTGHALPPPNPEGPFPLNLFMAPGDAGLEEMVAATRRGLLVTRFHYSNIVNPVESSITGMTRDGTWLIEDGEVRHPVVNLRFTQSILEALSAVSMVGRDTELASEFFFSASRVPALKIDRFRFTSRSDH